jgi:hypothetical protein
MQSGRQQGVGRPWSSTVRPGAIVISHTPKRGEVVYRSGSLVLCSVRRVCWMSGATEGESFTWNFHFSEFTAMNAKQEGKVIVSVIQCGLEVAG